MDRLRKFGGPLYEFMSNPTVASLIVVLKKLEEDGWIGEWEVDTPFDENFRRQIKDSKNGPLCFLTETTEESANE